MGLSKSVAAEQKGEELIRENVTLSAGESVGPTGTGNRNIIPVTGGTITGKITGKVLPGRADCQSLANPMTIDARYRWQTSDGGSMGLLAPAFEARADGNYAWLNKGLYLSSNPDIGQGGVAPTFYESR